MGLDTFYRPKRYQDVLGQQSIIAVLRQLVRSGKGFRQSYCFSGPYGTGKTTLARIFAKSLLCESPKEGEACDACDSCLIFLRKGSHPDFVEVDAASNSRKEDVERILESIKYQTFSGRKRVYAFDESQEISKAAQDSLLLPLENTLPGSEDKQLVCIFCTTDPSKMRPALLSRCAPSFAIGTVTPQVLADRLQLVCEDQKIPFEREALVLLAELCESHVRDCLKSIEVLSGQGGVTRDVVLRHLHHNYNDLILDLLLSSLSDDQQRIPELVDTLLEQVSPSFLYRKVAEICILAFRAEPGKFKVPGHYSSPKVQQLHDKGPILLDVARVFASKPYNVDRNTLICDLYFAASPKAPIPDIRTLRQKPEGSTGTIGKIEQPVLTQIGVYVDPAARKKPRAGSEKTPEKPLDLAGAKQLLAASLGALNGSKGSGDMGGS